MLSITDGFKTNFEFRVLDAVNCDQEMIEEFYGINRTSANQPGTMIAFNIDGGPKVASCVINNHLYNGAPSGWKFFP